MGVAEFVCYRWARHLVLQRQEGDAGHNPATFAEEALLDWRSSELSHQFRKFFGDADLAGCDVLDFGCGWGDLSFFVAGLGVRSVTGVDLWPDRIAAANRRAEPLDIPVKPRFQVAGSHTAIDLPDRSVDVLLCFDVLEHIMEYRAILPEWLRVLRPGGRVFIWWMPWLHPYGHHIEALVPIPWAHALFSDRTLIRVCARVYDMPEYRPRVWDLDEQGRKKPNKWLTLERLPMVNRLTIGRFEALCRELGLRVEQRRLNGISSSPRVAALSRFLTRLPGVREYVTSSVVYRLRTPGG